MQQQPKILLVSPECPNTFWSMKQAMKVFGKKALSPPLGLLTIASILPNIWEKKLVDMDVTPLTDDDIRWADYVFISAMVVQRESAREVIDRCKKLYVRTVAGGPLFTSEYEVFSDVDYLVLGEAENILPTFLADLNKGFTPHIYTSEGQPDISKSPLPMWSLINMNDYFTMAVQYSRGCPFDCEFCDIATLYGRKIRTKNRDQLLSEFDALYDIGWRDPVFIVDDNFIGNKTKLKRDILPVIIEWQKARDYPFLLTTQTSIDLADDEELMLLMVQAGFDCVFIGIETINEDSLIETNKHQNVNRDLVASVKRILNNGLQVYGGFIVGFDSDTASIFERQIDFIQETGIIVAMAGLLNAPHNTKLYQRLEKEGRLTREYFGDSVNNSINFSPRMGLSTLVSGYKHLLASIYSSNPYYARIKVFLQAYKQHREVHYPFRPRYLLALIKAFWLLGVLDQERVHFWRFFVSSSLKYPHLFILWMTFAVYGLHFKAVVRSVRAS